MLDRNYNLKLQNDDYRNMDAATAKKDFLSRVHAYEKVYEVDCIHTYIHTAYIYTYIHIYIHTYIQTAYIYTYIL